MRIYPAPAKKARCADEKGTRALPAALLPAVSIVVVLALSIVARRQIGYWADNVILWTHTIQVTPPNYVAQDNLGGALMAHKRLDDAIVHFREAAAIHPVDPISAFNIGFYDQEHGDFYGAIEQYKRAIILTTSPSVKIQAWNDMGIRLSHSGQHAAGARMLRGGEEAASTVTNISTDVSS